MPLLSGSEDLSPISIDVPSESERGLSPNTTDSRNISPGTSRDGLQGSSEPGSTRRRRGRSSAGFLLQPTPTTTPPFSRGLDTAGREHKEIKHRAPGPRWDDASPAQNSWRQRFHQRSAAEKSLHRHGTADSVRIQSDVEPETDQRHSEQSPEILLEMEHGTARRFLEHDRLTARPHKVEDHGRPSRVSSPSASLDLESARIINLALNLNESRRKSANFGNISPGYAANGRRSVSMIKPALEGNSIDAVAMNGRSPSESKERRSQEGHKARHASIYSSADHNVSAPTKRAKEDHLHSSPLESQATKASPFDTQQDFEYHFSKSTLARAERARNSLELAAEYRRLLQYLPPLRPTLHPLSSEPSTGPSSPTFQNSKNSLSRITSTSSTGGRLGRPYNPLQCRRNRKLRVPERRSLDSPAEGWTDVGKVKNWVDAVQEQSELQSSYASEPVPLPHFPLATHNLGGAQSRSAEAARQGTHAGSARGQNPRTDWQITPEDLFADAHWLEQGSHKILIEDRNGRKIFSHESSGEPLSRRENRRIGRSSRRGERSHGDTRGHGANMPVSSLRPRPKGFAVMRKRHQRHPSHTIPANKSELERSSQRRGLSQYHSNGHSSDSSESDAWRQGRFGVRKNRHRKGKASLDDMDSALLEKQMIALLLKEAEEGEKVALRSPTSWTHNSAIAEDGQSAFGIADHNHSNNMRGPHISGQQDASRSERSHPITQSQDELLHQPEASPASVNSVSARKSMDEPDTTATNSPQVNNPLRPTNTLHGLVPSIALNLSPPLSRHASPVRDSQKESGLSPERHKIDTNDFAVDRGEVEVTEDSLLRANSATTTPDRQKGFTPPRKLFSRKMDDSDNEGSTPLSRIWPHKRDHRHSEHPRLRGIFRSGKIEDMLRHEVSKIGEVLWKRETPPVASSSPTSPRNSEAVESEDGRRAARKQQMNGAVGSRVSLDDGDLSRTTSRSVGSKYHTSNLPAFVSIDATERASEAPEANSLAVQEKGPLHAQADRLLLSQKPSNISLLTTLDLSRAETRASEPSEIDSRRDSDASRERSISPFRLAPKGVRDADSRLNRALGTSGRLGVEKPFVTALSRLNPSTDQSVSSRITGDGHRHWSVSDAKVSASERLPDAQEIARIRALLLSSGVKAQEIVRRAKRIETIPPAILDGDADTNSLIVPHNDVHITAAQILSRNMERTMGLLHGSYQKLNNLIVPGLLGEISNIHNRCSVELTTEVRRYTDDADAFSAELTIGRSLAIKQLNDGVDFLMRQRRRRLRWVRRGGYVLLEWTLLGLMWWVWLIVVLIRLVRVTIRGVVTGVRWMFWL